jgi:16S rRNA (cytosine967-C5)-methyltransferase
MPDQQKKYDPVRAAVIEIISLVETDNEIVEEAIRKVVNKNFFSALDVRFLRQLVNGTVKMKRRLDHDIRYYLSKPSEKLPQALTNILRLGFYQLFFTDRIPAAAAVSESVNLAHRFCDNSRARLVNAVMRTALRHPERVAFVDPEIDPVSFLGNKYSYPDWFVSYCLKEFDFEITEKLLDDMNRPPSLSFRFNPLKTKANEIENELKKDGLVFSRGKYLSEFFRLEEGSIPPIHPLITEGKIYIQDESAGLPVRLMNPKMNMSVLDMAAAPGGKAAYTAVRMRNKGMITAIDKSRPRLKMMAENIERLGIKIINPVHADNLEFTAAPFDRVILDVPCSGWGNARKHSDLRWLKSPKDIDRLYKVQCMMIDKAAKLVKPGGILVYSTCTIIRKENDQVVEEFLLRRKDFELESAREYFDDLIVSERGFLKTYPLIGELSGSFAARLKKKIIHKRK